MRELRIQKDGSIAVEYVDTAISDAAREAERAAPGAVGDAVVWETVRARTYEDAELSFTFIAFMVLATLIAAMGILTDSLVLIIGAMIVGPEFGPLAGISVATVEAPLVPGAEVGRRACRRLSGRHACAAALLTLALVATGVAPDALPAGREATLFISRPDTFSVLVALAAGVAGTLSLTTVKSGALIGVLVSVTTIPAAANVAVAAAYGEWSECWHAGLQLAVNLGAIIFAGVVTLSLQRRASFRRLRLSRVAVRAPRD